MPDPSPFRNTPTRGAPRSVSPPAPTAQTAPAAPTTAPAPSGFEWADGAPTAGGTPPAPSGFELADGAEPQRSATPWLRSGPALACIGIDVASPGGDCGCSPQRLDRARLHLRAETDRFEDVREHLFQVYGQYLTRGSCDVVIYTLPVAEFNEHFRARMGDSLWGVYYPPIGVYPTPNSTEMQRRRELGLDHAVVVPVDVDRRTVFHELVHGYTHASSYSVRGQEQRTPIAEHYVREGLTEFLTKSAGYPNLMYHVEVGTLQRHGVSVDMAARALFQGEVRPMETLFVERTGRPMHRAF